MKQNNKISLKKKKNYAKGYGSDMVQTQGIY